MAKIILLLLLSISVNAQVNIFSPKHIDSIAKKNKCLALDSSSVLSIKKKRKIFGKKTIATGGCSYSTFYNDCDNRQSLIKGNYNEYLFYKDGHTEETYSEFYYNDSTLFLVRLKLVKQFTSNKVIENSYEIDTSQPIDHQIGKDFNLNIENWIKNKSLGFLDNK